MAALIQGPLAGALAARRERFNALFAYRHRTSPDLDAGAFADFLSGCVAPSVAAVATAAPESVQEVADALYELALELVARDLPRRCPAIAAAWRDLLPAAPQLLARDPRRLAGSVTNAVYNLETAARAARWVAAMRDLGRPAPDLDAFLEAGKVAAWRAGLAHYREGALAAAEQIPSSLALSALGVPAVGVPVGALLQRLRQDPWLAPETAANPPGPRRYLRIVGRAGAFRGFGGEFLTPPQVILHEGRIAAGDAETIWLIAADRFGATLQRQGPPSAPAPANGPLAPFDLAPDGTVRCAGLHRTFSELAGAASAVSDGVTFAVSTPLSHAICLVALCEEWNEDRPYYG